MCKAKTGTNAKKTPSLPGTNYTRPSGASPAATSNVPEVLAYAIKYGNRATRRLAEQNQASYKHLKLIGGVK